MLKPYQPKQHKLCLSVFLTQGDDVQRPGKKLSINYEKVKTWLRSCNQKGHKCVLFCDDDWVPPKNNLLEIIKVSKPRPDETNVYFRRWKLYNEWIKTHDVDEVWCMDCTDTEMLNAPKVEIGKIYAGDESGIFTDCEWMCNQNVKEYLPWVKANRKPLLNAGVLGGRAEQVLKATSKLAEYYHDKATDMCHFNMVCHDLVNLEYGRHITTIFKAQQRTNAWIRHK
jgi:hypothetical protein